MSNGRVLGLVGGTIATAIGLSIALSKKGKRDMTIPWGDSKLWMVPVPDLNLGGVKYPATVSQEWRATAPGVAGHYGIDLMYPRNEGELPEYAGHDGTKRFFAPQGTPVIAARDGVLWSADHSQRGFQIVLDHGKPFATYYQHIEKLSVPLAEQGKTEDGKVYVVRAGDVIGMMGYDPIDPEGLRHLHFAVWYAGFGDSASVNPGGVIGGWGRQSWDLGKGVV